MSTPASVVNTLQGVYNALGTFILAQLWGSTVPSYNAVFKGFPNRAALPSPSAAGYNGFIIMSAVTKKRLRTNVDTYSSTTSPAPAPGPVTAEMGQQVDVQIDVYGPNASDQSDILVTLLRDEVGCDALAPACQPLYADDPIRAPLDDSEMQYEDRWVITARIQYNPVVTVADEYATGLVAKLTDVTPGGGFAPPLP